MIHKHQRVFGAKVIVSASVSLNCFVASDRRRHLGTVRRECYIGRRASGNVLLRRNGHGTQWPFVYVNLIADVAHFKEHSFSRDFSDSMHSAEELTRQPSIKLSVINIHRHNPIGFRSSPCAASIYGLLEIA